MPAQNLSSVNVLSKIGGSNPYKQQPVTETLTNGFFTVDNKWKVKYWNKAAEELLHVKAIDIVGKNLWEKFAGSLPLEFYTVYYKAFIKDIPVHFEEYWGEMGAWFDVITYYSGDTLSVSFKSSNHPHAEYPESAVQRLKTLTELYRFVTEITNDCLWEWDLENGELFWIDGGHKRVFGYQIENALIPQSFWESRLHPDDKNRILARLNTIIMEGTLTVWEDRYRFQKANGDYAYVHDRGHIIYEGDKASRMIGATEDITDTVLLEKKLAEERLSQQKEITASVLAAQEMEREEIGKELHDNLNQVLAVANLYVQMANKNEKNRAVYLEKSSGMLVQVMQEIRRISKNLVIPGTHIITLFDNIKNLIGDLISVHPIVIEFKRGSVDENGISNDLQINIFRIIQEQLNNILKHSKATLAKIELDEKENQLLLTISDNGVGYDMLTEKKGVGIINIKSRVELYHGKSTIVSKAGEGCELKIILPLNSSL